MNEASYIAMMLKHKGTKAREEPLTVGELLFDSHGNLIGHYAGNGTIGMPESLLEEQQSNKTEKTTSNERKIIEYYVAYGTSLTSLQKAVESYIHQGCVPFEAPFFTERQMVETDGVFLQHQRYHQAMVKYES